MNRILFGCEGKARSIRRKGNGFHFTLYFYGAPIRLPGRKVPYLHIAVPDGIAVRLHNFSGFLVALSWLDLPG
ncbi:MAG: hypothetical protein ABR957_16035, partial [Terracidiphilus sp.]